jgi:hypothetical protein
MDSIGAPLVAVGARQISIQALVAGIPEVIILAILQAYKMVSDLQDVYAGLVAGGEVGYRGALTAFLVADAGADKAEGAKIGTDTFAVGGHTLEFESDVAQGPIYFVPAFAGGDTTGPDGAVPYFVFHGVGVEINVSGFGHGTNLLEVSTLYYHILLYMSIPKVQKNQKTSPIG